MKKKTKRTAMFLLTFGFLLGVKNNRVALWIDEDPEPAHIFCVEVSSLPPADQILLRRGIRAESEAQLISLIEDYLP